MIPSLKIGATIDDLRLISVSEIKKYGTHRIAFWNCLCKCGNSCTISEASLKDNNHHHSCGCYQKKLLTPGDATRASKAGKARAEKRNVDGVNVDMLFRKETISTNTSGVQGVSWDKNCHKWHCYLGYKNKRANLGYFEDKNDAIKIRQMGIEAIKEGTFEEFYKAIRGKEY